MLTDDDLEPLPPLDAGDEEDASPAEAVVLPALDFESGNDDEMSHEVDSAISIHSLDDPGSDEPEGDALEGANYDLTLTEVTDTDDSTGIDGLDTAADLSEVERFSREDTDDDPALDPFDGISDEPLPDLDADDALGLDSEAVIGIEAEIMSAPERPPWATARWTVGVVDRAPCAAIAIAESGATWVAGRLLFRIDFTEPSTAEAIVQLTRPATSVAVVRGTIVVATVGGDIHRVDPASGQARSVASDGQRAVSDGDLSIVVLGQGGRLVASRDGGLSFRPVETAAPVNALGPWEPFAALVGGAHLISSADGRTWVSLRLDAVGAEVARAPGAIVAATGSLVALAAADAGLAVSMDAGASFQRVAGCAQVTALAVEREEPARVWAALHDRDAERSEIVTVDPVTLAATRIALIEAPAEDDSNAGARVSALGHHPISGNLVAVGAFGIVLLRRPT